MRERPVGLAMWLLLLAGAQVVALLALIRFFVRSEHGQSLDTVALAANAIGQARVGHLVDTVLNTISALWLAVALVVVSFIALARRRVAVASGAIILVVGANLTTELLKHIIDRPDLGIDPERAGAGNSLPSGHTAVAASVAFALLLVLPARLRGIGAVIGAVFTSVVGVATLSAGWHRPSDSVAAVLVVGAWACAAGLFILWAQDRNTGVDYGRVNWRSVTALVVSGLVLLASAWFAVDLTDQVLSTPPDELSRFQLLVGYAGGAAFIAGAASLVLASVLATAHRVVPHAVSTTGRNGTRMSIAPIRRRLVSARSESGR